MSEQSAFDRKSIMETTTGTGRGILDELHLPPKVISFIRENQKNLQIVGIVFVVLILALTAYRNYSEGRRDKAAALLVSAMKSEDVSSRVQLLDKLQDEYSGTASALWGRVEMGHLDYQTGNFAGAVSKYEAILKQLKPDSSLRPLIQYSLAQALEEQKSFDRALSLYQEIAKINGYAKEAFTALGRIYEMKNEPAKARDAYEQFLELSADSPNSQTGSTTAIVKEKLARLQGGEPVGAGADK